MTFARAHQLLTISGTHFGLERFTFGIRLNNVGGTFPATQSAQDDLCDDYANAIAAWWPTQQSIGETSKLDLVKLNEISPAGRYARTWTNLTEVTPPVGGSFGSGHSPQTCLVVTLETGATRGYASRGRLFWPSPAMTVQATNGQITVAKQTQALADAKALLEAIKGVDTGRIPIVASAVGAGAERSVTGVSVGLVLDTMRSRRTSLAESRVPVALAGATF